VDEAIREYRKAIDLDRKFAGPHHNLGLALLDKGQLDEAIQEYRTAIALEPRRARHHGGLGQALSAKGDVEGAIREYRLALDGDSKDAVAHGALGQALLQQGQFAEAQASTRRCLELLPESDPRRAAVTRQLKKCEHLLDLEQKLPQVLQGQIQPTNAAERLEYAKICMYKQLHATAAKLFADSFAAPEMASHQAVPTHYSAACAAALAGSGQGKDAGHLDDQERSRLRRQAVDWLRLDLAAWTKFCDGNNPNLARAEAARALQVWQAEACLASLRDKDALAKLPPAERAMCQKLWADVVALLARVKPEAKEAPQDKP
jgi:tetratricopeptide (TPR) repeat protein